MHQISISSELEGDNLVEVNKNKPFAGRQMTNEPNRRDLSPVRTMHQISICNMFSKFDI